MRQLLDNASEIEECSKGVRPLLFLCFLPHLNGNCAGVSIQVSPGLGEVLFNLVFLIKGNFMKQQVRRSVSYYRSLYFFF